MKNPPVSAPQFENEIDHFVTRMIWEDYDIRSKWPDNFISPDDFQRNWRTKIPYSPYIENRILTYAGIFLQPTMTNKGSRSNPDYMTNLTRQFINYISLYTMGALKYNQDDRKAKNAARRQAKKILEQTVTFRSIFSDIKKLRQLNKEWAQRKIRRHSTPKCPNPIYMSPEDISRQVHLEFIIVQSLGRRK